MIYIYIYMWFCLTSTKTKREREMHIMPGAVKIERRSSGKSSTAPGLGTDPLDLLPIDEALPSDWRGNQWGKCDFRNALMVSGNHIGIIFFSILGRKLWGVARRSQAGPITFTSKKASPRRTSTIFNNLRFQHSKIQHPPDTAVLQVFLAVHFGCFSFGSLAPLNSLLQGEVHV